MVRPAKISERRFPQIARFLTFPVFGVAVALFLTGCSCEEQSASGDEARDPVTGLTATEAKEVLVSVGDRNITLGDYAGTLLRMDQFERLRYQTEERQKMLLDEMIEVELLAQEAKRRGLDKDPEVQLQLQQSLRDELLRSLEAGLPAAADIPEREVREYYDAHRSEFKEPERRRVMMIKLGTQSLFDEVIEKAQGASGEVWGKLAKQYSLDHNVAAEALAKGDFSGDMGFVSGPGVERGKNAAVPEEARVAVFGLKKVGDVAPKAVVEDGFYYLVRLGGISPARDRTVLEADRAIRIELRRQKFLQAEKDLEAELRKKYPVKIDQEAVKNFKPQTPLHRAPPNKVPPKKSPE